MAGHGGSSLGTLLVLPHPALDAVRTVVAVPNTSDQPDDVVIVALAERDLGALATLYDRYGRLAYALAYRILGEGEAAEDVVHDAYISAWRGAATYRRERGNVRGWLMSIVHHRAVDVLRRKTTFRPAPLWRGCRRRSGARSSSRTSAATRTLSWPSSWACRLAP